MKIQLPQYSGKDYLVMIGVVPLFTLFINYNIFDKAYFTDGRLFIWATIITGFGFCLDFILCGGIAVAMKNRFPREQQLMKRLTFMILIFLLLTGLFLYALFQWYERDFFSSYHINQMGFVWSYFFMGIINVLLTFLMEGISRYQQWKTNWEETEVLKKSFRERQLLGLKSQVNQHFLFDSLHSLSMLIKKEGEEAEIFLNAMSKVYRYILGTEDEPLVALDTELKFIESYGYLLKARHGESLQLQLNVSVDDRDKCLPPLSLQLIIEDILSNNEISIDHPLKISICSAGDNVLKISNTVLSKANGPQAEQETGLGSLVNNYRLISAIPMVIDDAGDTRNIHLPIFNLHKTKPEEMI